MNGWQELRVVPLSPVGAGEHAGAGGGGDIEEENIDRKWVKLQQRIIIFEVSVNINVCV